MSAPPEDRLDRALSYLAGRETDMEDLLRRLVDENSFTENAAGGRRVGAMLREAFAGGGLSCESRSSRLFADHLVFATAAHGAPGRARGTSRHRVSAGHVRGVSP